MVRDVIVGGLVAGLVAGSMVAGAVVVTRGTTGPTSSGPVEVYGEVTIGNGYSGSGANNPVLVKIDQPAGQQAPDGSQAHPFYITQGSEQPAGTLAPDGSQAHPFYITQGNPLHVVQDGPVYVWSCDSTGIPVYLPQCK